MKKGQISIEMLFAAGIMIIIFTFLLGLALNKSIEINQLEKEIKMKGECKKLSNFIIGVFINGNGTKIESSIKYDASINPQNRLISIENDYVTCTLPLNQTTQSNLNKGEIEIENKNNMVTINND